MSGFPPHLWSRLKNLTCDEIIAALKKDVRWKQEPSSGAILVFRRDDGRRVGIHYHPKKTYGAKLLKNLLDSIGWSEEEMRKFKLI